MWRVVIAVAGLTGCSKTYDLTCPLLADPSNCFAQQAAALEACIPMRATPGTLSSDQKTCAFSDGVHIVFEDPLPATDVYSAVGLRMTVFAPDGSTCGHLYYDDTSDGNEIQVNNATWDEFGGAGTVNLYCPSHTYEGQLSHVLACGPSMELALIKPVYSVTLSTADLPTPLFSCQ